MAELLNVSTSLPIAKILLDYCKGIHEDINIYLNDDNWNELDMAIKGSFIKMRIYSEPASQVKTQIQ